MRDEILRSLRRISSLLFICGLCLSGCQPADPLSAYPWLYQREGQAATADHESLSVIVVGDILLGRGVSQPEQAFACQCRLATLSRSDPG